MIKNIFKKYGDDGYKPNNVSVSSVLPGTYTVSQMTSVFAAANKAKYAFVTDLGGGADMVLSDGFNWKHIRQGVVTNIAINSTLNITPLSSPPIIQLTGNAFVGTSTININTTNLYTGYISHIIIPSGVLSTVTGLLGFVGLSVGGGTTIPLLGGTWQDSQWNGTNLVEIARGTL